MSIEARQSSVPAVVTAAVALLLASMMVAQRNQIGFDFWPDIVCQLFVGWRIAEGDALYTQIWESHPPAAVLMAAVPHLFADPGYGVAVGYLVALALAVFASNLAFLRAFLRAPWLLGGCLALAGAAYFYRYLIGARSEDVMIVCGTAALAIAAFGIRAGSSIALPMLAGAVSGFGLLSKPGAVAAAAACFLIVVIGSPRRWTSVLSFAAGAALPMLAVALWLGESGLAGAYRNVVEYGRAYFQQFDEVAPSLSFDLLPAGGLPLLVASYGVSLVALGPWILARLRLTFPSLGNWQVRTLFLVLFVAWPVLEAAVILPQTSFFAYIFFPLAHSLLLLTSVAVCVASGQLGSAVRKRAVAKAVFASMLLAGLLGIVAFVSVADGRWEWLSSAFRPGKVVPGPLRQSPQTTAVLDAAQRVRAEQERLGGGVLWFDVAPAIAYFARARNVIPEYISHPLFLRGFASEEAWQRVQVALDREDVNIVLVWAEWYNVVQPKGTTAETLAEQSAKILADRFRKVGEFDVYAGRQPVQMFVASKWPRSAPDSHPSAPPR
jgi:hypothetical protein